MLPSLCKVYQWALNSLLDFLKPQRENFDCYHKKASELRLQYSDEGKRVTSKYDILEKLNFEDFVSKNLGK